MQCKAGYYVGEMQGEYMPGFAGLGITRSPFEVHFMAEEPSSPGGTARPSAPSSGPRCYGELVGEDEFGNRYYRTKGGKIDPTLGFERRWVIYNGVGRGLDDAAVLAWLAASHRRRAADRGEATSRGPGRSRTGRT